MIQINFYAFVFDETDTLVPVSYVREDIISYMQRTDLKDRIRERTGIDDMGLLLERVKSLKKESPETFKDNPVFREYIDALDIGRQLAYEKRELPPRVFPDVSGTLNAIKEVNRDPGYFGLELTEEIKVGIYSSADTATLKAGWDLTPFRFLIDHYFSAKDEKTKSKLAPASYEEIAHKMSVGVEKMVYVTDTEAEAAVKARVGSVYLIDREKKHEGKPEGFKVIDNLEKVVSETILQMSDE